MKKVIFFILLMWLVLGRVFGQDRIDWDQIKAAPGSNYVPVSNVSGDGVWTAINAILSGANSVYGTGSAGLIAEWLNDSTLTFDATGAYQLSVGTDAQRPTGASGLIRYNTTSGNLEWYNSSDWEKPVLSSTAAGTFTAGSVLFADANGRAAQDNSGLFFGDSNNRLGVGQSSPSASIDVKTPAISGRELVFSADVSDADYTQFGIGNGTSTSGIFAPVFYGYQVEATRSALTFRSIIPSSIDAHSTTPTMSFQAFRVTSAVLTDPNNAGFSDLANIDLFDFRGLSDVYMTIEASGQIGIGTQDPARLLHVAGEARITDLTTDTPARIVGADADGDLGAIALDASLSLSGGTLAVASPYTGWTLAGDSGTQAIASGNTATFTGGWGIVTAASATDVLTIRADSSEVATQYDLTTVGNGIYSGNGPLTGTSTYASMNTDGSQAFYLGSFGATPGSGIYGSEGAGLWISESTTGLQNVKDQFWLENGYAAIYGNYEEVVELSAFRRVSGADTTSEALIAAGDARIRIYARGDVGNADNYIAFATTGQDRLVIAQDGIPAWQGTSAQTLHSGTTAQRPTGVNYMLRGNSDTTALEVYYGGAWETLADRDWVRANISAGKTFLNGLTETTDTVRLGGNLTESTVLYGLDSYGVGFDGLTTFDVLVADHWIYGGDGYGGIEGSYTNSPRTYKYGFANTEDGQGYAYLYSQRQSGTGGDIAFGLDSSSVWFGTIYSSILWRLPATQPAVASGAKSTLLQSGNTSTADATWGRIDYGSASGTTDGSGDLTVNCVMPDASYVVKTTVTGTTFYVVTAHTKGSTSFKLRFFDAAGAAQTSASVTVDWALTDN